MWVFGYGSLIWDDWEKPFGCTQKVTAILSGYRRAFNKASVRNWGTREHPGPTLNLEERNGERCIGFAFEFPTERQQAVMQSLREREGGGFCFPELEIVLPDGGAVRAATPIYRGENVIRGRTLEEVAEMVMQARGTKGACRDYVLSLAKRLKESSIDDPVVSTLTERLR